MVIKVIITIVMLLFAIRNDVKDKLIKNKIPFWGGSIGIILSFIYPNQLIINLVVCILFFFCLFAIPRLIGISEFMGAGDIKIYMAITLLLGYEYGVYSFIYSIFVGVIVLIILNLNRLKEVFQNIFLFFNSNKKSMAKLIDSKDSNIFSPYILIGVIITFIQMFIFQNNWLFLNIK